MRPRSFAVLTAIVLFSVCGLGQQPFVRNLKVEQAILDKLVVIAPHAVEPFQRATAAMDAQRYGEAIPLFQQVLQQAPSFTPAMRRLGASLAGSGKVDEGLIYCRSAVQIERSPENLANLAGVLSYPAPNQQGSAAQMQEALPLAKEANDNYHGDDASYPLLVAQLALNLESDKEFRQATEILVKTHPEMVATHYFNAIRLAEDEDWIASEDEMRTAERLGLPADKVEAMLSASGIHRHAMMQRFWRYPPWVLGAWVGALVLLFVVGKILSGVTLRMIQSADPGSSLSGGEVFLRQCYRRLITFAGSFYYISLPFVIVLVLGLAGGMIYAFLMMGRIPIKLALILVIGAIVTVYKMVQSLFVRVDDSQPGRSLPPEEAPDFWNLTREVADKLGTRPLDQIRITPGTEMAVYEHGTRKERRQDMAQRTLVMGVGLIPGFQQNAFRAVLAHEYGHLSHRDTAGGDVALRVNRDMINFAIALAVARQAVPWNLAFQFLRVYHFLFRRISYGATRLQEVLADRAAASLYGAPAFEEGLRHVVRRQIEFENVALHEVKVSNEGKIPFRNIYTLPTEPSAAIDDEVDKALHRETSEDDTHPSPVDRFRYVQRVPCDQPQTFDGVMWDLFTNPESLTAEMTSQIESRVKDQIAQHYATVGSA
ncbi:MAG TPA: M48 family metalloprotease [Candidatus Sulfotelmatobacter sp.]|nr:M48 family metalloprotease [Candidatus Sulfotelmatobacter sp.]